MPETQQVEISLSTPPREARLPPVLKPAEVPKTISLRPEQEIDVWYLGYAGRVMLLGFMVCLVLSVAGIFAWWRFSEPLSPVLQGLVFSTGTALLGALWLFQLFRWGYRKLTYQSRLTTRRLFCHRGFLHGKPEVVDLARVGKVEVRRNPWERCLGVGRIWIYSEADLAKPIVLEGVSKPLSTAETIRRQAAKAREGQIISARVTV